MPIPTSIRAVFQTAIPAMTAPTYHLGYDQLDGNNPVLWVPGLAQVALEISGWNPTSAIAQVVGKITQASLLTFKVQVPKGLSDIDAEMEKADSDFKRLMTAIDPDLKTAGPYRAEYQGSAIAYTLNETYPGEISIRFSLTWRQSRLNPEST